jgi:pimeloyl-ACP methyl ester carboxylesterase
MPTYRRPILLSALLLLTGVSGARGDLIIFKDGFMLQGKVRQQGSFTSDAETGQAVFMPRGSYILDADARRIFFSPTQLQDVERTDPALAADVITLTMPLYRYNILPMHDVVNIVGATDWDAKWERTFKIDALFKIEERVGRLHIKQRLGLLTPTVARVDAVKYGWNPFYQTRELGPGVVRQLLANHPDLKLTKSDQDAARQFKIYRFLAQAGWYDEAEQELQAFAKAWPNEKEKIDVAKENLQKLRTLQLYEEIQLAHKAGRHRWVQEQLANFPQQGADEKLAAGIRALKANYESANENLKNARRLLKDLPEHLFSTPRRLFTEATTAILEELTYENVGRLQAFIGLALQAERDLKQGLKPAHDPGALLALAVSGWLLGKDSAEAKVDVALRLWQARQFVLAYQKTVNDDDRDQSLKGYKKGAPVAVDELTQIIGLLPPPEPEKEISEEPAKLETNLPWGGKKGIPYVVQMPPEYHIGRLYPVVFALHHGEEKPLHMLERLSQQAAKHGYILVAPEWHLSWDENYRYTTEEHAAVLDVLRDLRRRFQVDSDRVFLVGVGDGGNMAYDVGLSHPDQFAGIVPVCGMPQMFAERYSPNAQYLPFYVVAGDHAGNVPQKCQEQFKRWLPLGYPALYISYKGRLMEWFEAEVPTMFEWMDHKKERYKRATAVPELGKVGGSLPQDFQTMRQTDNRFYWLSTEGVREGHVNDPRKWKGSIFAATLQGRIAEGNQINITVRSLKQLTVWLTKDMVDFSKPVIVRVNNRILWNNRKVEPSLGTLLEDLYLRGDRQRLFWAKLDFDKP